MGKKSIICAVLSLSLILVGTGYAYWTDTLNVTTKATTGDLDVTFADLGLFAQYDNETKANEWSIIDGIGDKGYVDSHYFMRGTSDFNEIAKTGTIDDYYQGAEGYNNVKFDAELVGAQAINKSVGPYITPYVNGSDNILLTVENMYPGYAQAFRTDILNVGTIAAKLSKIKVNTSATNGVTKDMLGVAVLIEREYYTGPSDEGTNVFELCSELGLSDADIFTVGGVEFARLSALENISKKVSADFNEILAVPSESRMDLYIGVAMDPDAEGIYTTGSTEVMAANDDSLSQNTSAEISIDLLWDQFNEGVNIDATNRLEEQNR